MDVTAKDIDRWHRERGFLKIGYHFFIRRDGTREKGREINEAGAHVAGYNHKSVAVCMAGGSKHGAGNSDSWEAENNFTEAQWAMLYSTLKELREFYPKAKIVGHTELDSRKACPSFSVPGYMEEHPDLYPAK